MGRLVVASQLPEEINGAVAAGLGDVDILTLPAGTPDSWPDKVEVFVAAPFRQAGGPMPPRPPGWPFNLKWIQLISVGIDFYPPWLFDGPQVTSARGTSALALAEFALAALFAGAKRFPDIWIDRAAEWHHSRLGMVEGGTLGILGFGSLGRALAPRARALGLKVLAVRHSPGALNEEGVERAASVADLFERSDHLVLAAPATAETRHLVNRQVLVRAKPGLHLINVARGALIDDNALLDALDSGRIGRATLDVTDPEPLPEQHPFYRHPKIFLSPHTSVITPDTYQNLAAKLTDNLIRYRSGAPLLDLVDRRKGY
jgi:phosphoglycerate dehydrogenase-like enzyme